MFRRVWVVQDADTGEFLRPTDDGDVGFTKFLRHAGRFEKEAEAVDTGAFNCTEFSLTSFFEEGE